MRLGTAATDLQGKKFIELLRWMEGKVQTETKISEQKHYYCLEAINGLSTEILPKFKFYATIKSP